MQTTCTLAIPNQDHLADQIRANASLVKSMVQENSHQGKTLAICGAGPSLAPMVKQSFWWADEAWACNSALPFLLNKGVRVTHGFTVDQGEEMHLDWPVAYDVDYLLASSVHPSLAKRIVETGKSVTWFHNYVGLKPGGLEYELYSTLYPPGPQVGYGLNSVPRAMCLALWMGFSTIKVYGADHAARPTERNLPAWGTPEWIPFLQSTVLYADGRSAFDAYGPDVTIVQGTIDGKHWHTRPDMVISAQHVANLAKVYPDRIELVGDTLPNALLNQSEEWLETCPQLNSEQGVTGFEMVTA